MASTIARGGKLYAKIKNIDGNWQRLVTPFLVGQEEAAQKWADDLEQEAERARPPRPHRAFKYTPRMASLPSTRSGWVYAIALDPTSHPFAVKVGYTGTRIEHRLTKYRTSNPFAVAIGAWDADESDEALAHRALSGRLGQSEVFATDNLERLLSTIDATLARRL